MLWDSLVGVFAPHHCVKCNQEGGIVCRDCFSNLAQPKASTCYLCNRLCANWRVCKACQPKTKINGVIVATYYRGEVKELIGQLKYRRAVAAAKPLAQLLAARLSPLDFDLITWVPASTRRQRQRGYNQAQLIAKYTGRILNLPYRNTLNKLGQNRQVGSSRRVRLTQTQNTMYAVPAQRIRGKRILVIDDVVTTGATFSECARALKASGASKVWGAAVAKH